MANTHYCRSCGAPIKWVKTFSGKRMPVDVPGVNFVEGGNALFVTDEGAAVHGTMAEEPKESLRFGYVSHFATCPNANRWRKKA